MRIPKHGWAHAWWYSLQWVVAMWATLLKGIILSCSYGYTSLVNHSSALGLSKIFFIEGCSEATPTMNTSLLCTEWEDGRHRCPSRCRCILHFITLKDEDIAYCSHQTHLTVNQMLDHHNPNTFRLKAHFLCIICSQCLCMNVQLY